MPAGGTDPRPTLLAGHLAPDSPQFFENKIKIELHLFICWALAPIYRQLFGISCQQPDNYNKHGNQTN